jgi:hypothetical protein
MIAALTLLAAAATTAAYPRIEPLSPPPAPAATNAAKTTNRIDSDTLCTVDNSRCFALSQQEETNALQLTQFDGSKDGPSDPASANETWIFDTGIIVEDGEDFKRKLWPHFIRQTVVHDDGAEPVETLIIGIITSVSAMYSGGGGQAEDVRLYRVPDKADGTPALVELLSLPLNTGLIIRACFSDKDYRNRRGVCHDNYDYNATITLAPKQDKTALARLVYRATTITTPGSSRRSKDNSGGRKLTAADIKPRTDPRCTYRRTIAFNPTTKQYEFDRPGPDCSEYTVP